MNPLGGGEDGGGGAEGPGEDHHRAADEFAPDHAGCYSAREGRDLEGIFVCLCTGIAGSSARAALQHVSQRPCADGQRLRESVHEVPIVLQNVPCSQGGI
jgi:hypothetical protein